MQKKTLLCSAFLISPPHLSLSGSDETSLGSPAGGTQTGDLWAVGGTTLSGVFLAYER